MLRQQDTRGHCLLIATSCHRADGDLWRLHARIDYRQNQASISRTSSACVEAVLMVGGAAAAASRERHWIWPRLPKPQVMARQDQKLGEARRLLGSLWKYEGAFKCRNRRKPSSPDARHPISRRWTSRWISRAGRRSPNLTP